MKFIPRLTPPTTTDKNYMHYSKGGYNYCILIGAKSCIPNCVGYAWGRWRELLGKYHKLSRANAENWFITNDGYERRQIPKVGAIACWQKGKTHNGGDGAGHVAVVEQINPDGSILTSNSGYNSTRFYLKTIKPPYELVGYKFQGFIYLPIEFNEEIKENNSNDNNTNENKYKVVKGDTLSKIALKFYGNADYKHYMYIAKANNIKNPNIINIGQVLVIPEYKEIISNDYKVGDLVHFDYLYTDSYGSKKLKALIHSGYITKIYPGRKAPYLINNGSGFLSKEEIK